MRRRIARIAYMLSATLILMALAVIMLARHVPGFAEWYAAVPRAAWYSGMRALTDALDPFTAPYTLFELAMLILMSTLALCGLAAIARALRRHVLAPLLSWLRALGCCAAALAAVLAALWLPMYDIPPLDTGQSGECATEELLQLIHELNRLAEADSESLLMHADGSFRSAYDRAELYRQSYEAYAALGLGEYVRAPRLSRANDAMRRLGIAGIYIPFTGETTVLRDEMDSALPFTLTHELAHQLGYAREDEANLVAYAVCARSEWPEFRYSGNLTAIRYAMIELLARDAGEFERAWGELGASVRTDLAAQRAFSPPVRRAYSEAVSAFSASVLRAGEYNGVTQLMLAHWRTIKPA